MVLHHNSIKDIDFYFRFAGCDTFSFTGKAGRGYNRRVEELFITVSEWKRRGACGAETELKKGETDMDVKEQIKTAIDKITKDKELREQFQKEPVKALESILGVDLPDDVINQVIQGVKAKLTIDKASGAVDAIKKLF